ncbi:TPA: hypothetical protein TZM69_000385 [Streptococcus suis]|nr:hypothetical protein [Streptococcus suis]HEL1739424.1 hypothetical protein [Streptococcus suis]HEL2045695.1 hypothetical protein [Streptococcus suis]HEL2046542.1 hypothetical protein [Streptococcus suis]HEL2171844.1 hypothetical protein [Streptococcus suis]
MRFKDFNLKVVTVERASMEYNMTVNKNFVTFSKGIIQELDYPAYVLIAFNKETKVMGLQVCRAKTRGSFKFSKPEGEQKGIVQVMNKNLKETLLHIMSEWDEAKRYKVEGIHIPEDKAFVFELSKFEELPDFRKNGK